MNATGPGLESTDSFPGEKGYVEPQAGVPAPESSRCPFWLIIALVAALGGWLRWRAAAGDLWLDEIWTLRLACPLEKPWQVFTSLHHDNNHPLNSLLAWFIGMDAPARLLRLPAVLAGVLSVVLAGLLGREIAVRPGQAVRAAVGPALLVAVSYLAVHYGSELRGYSLAVCFSLLAWWGAERWVRRGGGGWAALQLAAVVLALCSHFSSVFLCAALPLLALPSSGWWPGWRAAWLAVANSLIVAAAWWLLVRGQAVGMGTITTDPWPVLARAAGFAWGMPAAVAGLLLAVAAIGVPALTWRKARGRALFLAVSCVALPLLALAVQDNGQVYERYFLVPLVVLTIAGAALLAGLASRAQAVALGVLCLLGASQTLDLSADGRGGYAQALRDLAGASGGRRMVVASDHDFRNGLVFGYHAGRQGLMERFEFIATSEAVRRHPEWILRHQLPGQPELPDQFPLPGGPVYRRVSIYPCGPLSGFAWHTYRRVDPAAPAP